MNTKALLTTPRRPHRHAALALAAALALVASTASARVNVVTLPQRDSVQLTIYNSVDLTMVKETRFLTFRRGINRLEFSWANTLIDPTSVEFRALTHADEVEVMDISFPPRVTNALEWRIQSEFAGEVQVEIRYFTSGIQWSADYLAEATRNEQLMALAGSVRVTNNSGEDYENAQVRLVVGVIKLVEEIAQLAQLGRPGGQPRPESAPAPAAPMPALAAKAEVRRRMADAVEKPKEIAKEALSEYFLYTVEGKDTIPTGWSKRMPSFRANEVPIVSFYKYERERWGDQVMRYYRFTNSVPSKLGKEPLPDGDVKAFRLISDDQLYSFVGSTRTKYIPLAETVDLELGPDQEVRVQPKLMTWEKTDIRFDNNGNVAGRTFRESWQIELQNSKAIDALVDIRRNFAGDWSIDSADAYEKVDATKVKFLVPLKPGEKKTLSYTVTTRHGLNVTR